MQKAGSGYVSSALAERLETCAPVPKAPRHDAIYVGPASRGHNATKRVHCHVIIEAPASNGRLFGAMHEAAQARLRTAARGRAVGPWYFLRFKLQEVRSVKHVKRYVTKSIYRSDIATWRWPKNTRHRCQTTIPRTREEWLDSAFATP